ncbi:transcription termination factor MTERF2, chloroplastic-like [Cornus florida]|uniref:transcription termination factor MTERF2, chloroplastic-like n=1 Tax=Cornus florida TaxID=4283 RepID=UPI00289D57FD|nr:transcription termination factor MTERF2, chloroplastic-like [Cornus florida]
MLDSSLENRIKPTLNFLKQYVRTNENLIYALKRSIHADLCNVQKVMVPNINTLLAHDVPESHIGKLIMSQPSALMSSVDVFEEATDAVQQMGFDPKKTTYLWGIHSMLMNAKLSWEKKKEAYMSFGWSESTFNSAFKLEPMCMLSSQKNIRELMDFLVNKAELRASEIAKHPKLFRYSLERRLIPRCTVLQILMSKGLIGKDVEVAWVLNCNTQNFETRFLTKYKKVAHEVIKACKGEIGFQGFNTRV